MNKVKSANKQTFLQTASLATDNQDYLEMTGQKGQVTVGSAFYLQCKNVQPDKMNNLRWIYRDENGEEITLNRKFRVLVFIFRYIYIYIVY